MFQGVFTAIVTPINKDKIDERALRELTEWQIQEGVHGIVACGSTGEAMTLSEDEWERTIEIVVEQAKNRLPVIAGAGSNWTEKAVKLTKKAYKLGVAATLQVTPYYNKPTQEGLYQHFKAIAAACDLPVVLYNVPGRTAVNMLPETVARLSKISNIVGIKEASGDLNQIKKIRKLAGEDFIILSGEDAQNFAIYQLGGVGAISVASNIAPQKVASVWDKFEAGLKDEAKFIQEELLPLNKAIFIETNPIPVKTALAMMKKIKEEFRLPLTPMSSENKKRFEEVLKSYNLI
ncbi:MAG: 4-hydroxy-tetrahydrodipicolinate synthase [Deltaproteobacteria bacterium]|nr:4-hydroxy-tetrahydrodipicolinate synthase [Deltaproteobacteria bacterium]